MLHGAPRSDNSTKLRTGAQRVSTRALPVRTRKCNAPQTRARKRQRPKTALRTGRVSASRHAPPQTQNMTPGRTWPSSVPATATSHESQSKRAACTARKRSTACTCHATCSNHTAPCRMGAPAAWAAWSIAIAAPCSRLRREVWSSIVSAARRPRTAPSAHQRTIARRTALSAGTSTLAKAPRGAVALQQQLRERSQVHPAVPPASARRPASTSHRTA